MTEEALFELKLRRTHKHDVNAPRGALHQKIAMLLIVPQLERQSLRIRIFFLLRAAFGVFPGAQILHSHGCFRLGCLLRFRFVLESRFFIRGEGKRDEANKEQGGSEQSGHGE